MEYRVSSTLSLALSLLQGRLEKSHVGSQRVLTRCSPVILFLRESKSFLKNWEGGWEEKSGRSHKKEQGAHGPPRFGEVLASVDAGLDVDCSK
jgi:hypothetical protein